MASSGRDSHAGLTAEEFSARFQSDARVLWTLAAGLLGDSTEAEDVCQEAFIAAYGKRDRFEPGTNFLAWMGRFVRNVATNELRKRARRQPKALAGWCRRRGAFLRAPAFPCLARGKRLDLPAFPFQPRGLRVGRGARFFRQPRVALRHCTLARMLERGRLRASARLRFDEEPGGLRLARARSRQRFGFRPRAFLRESPRFGFRLRLPPHRGERFPAGLGALLRIARGPRLRFPPRVRQARGLRIERELPLRGFACRRFRLKARLRVRQAGLLEIAPFRRLARRLQIGRAHV